MLETSLEAKTKIGPGEVTESLGISPYWLIWYLAILFFSFQSGAQHDPEQNIIGQPN